MSRSIWMVGSSGHAAVVAEALRAKGEYELAGVLDDFRPLGEEVFNCAVVGRLANAAACAEASGVWSVVVAVGDNWRRGEIMRRFDHRWEFPVVQHPAAVISSSAQLGAGSVVLAGSVVGPRCQVGRGCLVNTLASLDHDGVMEDYASLAPGAICGGNVQVGSYSAVGLGAKVIHRMRIGSHTVIGAGATVVREIPSHAVAWGTPARVQRKRQEAEEYL